MSFEGDLSETFSQINAAGQASIANVNVSITDGGNIVGQGITASSHALGVCGGNLDAIIKSFGGNTTDIQGGAKEQIGGKVKRVMSSVRSGANKLDSHLEKTYSELQKSAADLKQLAHLAKEALDKPECSKTLHEVLKKIANYMGEESNDMLHMLEKELKVPKQKVSEFLKRHGKFTEAINTLGAQLSGPNMAGMVSLSFSNVNDLKHVAKEVEDALKTVHMKKGQYVKESAANLDRELTHKLEETLKSGHSTEKLRAFLSAWKTLLEHHGHAHKLEKFIGGAMGDKLVDRLHKSREELKNIINKFIMAFGSNLNEIVSSTNELSKHLGKDILYTDDTVQFLDAFTRLNEYLNSNKAKFYQHLLEINNDTVDSKEIKSRFVNNLRVLAEKANAMGSIPALKKFVSACDAAVSNVDKFSDMVKMFRDEVKKDGGNANDVMNELYSVDASKIEISALINPLENLGLAIKKLEFFKNIALFRSNLSQTNKELAVYSRDYEKSVGQAIGQAITRINNEYTEIMNQISDDKSGMGLEIDMYNESLPNGQKISKEKLKTMYKWQCDARVGLYKTIEAIDLYLLHFTDAISKNPDSVSDLNKLLAATKIIARWYDQKAGDNIIRVFESFRLDAAGNPIDSDTIESDTFMATYAGDAQFADLTQKVGGDKASKIYERCKRAVQGVVVLKNIISYFMSLGEKYGDFKSEKSIYMAPSNIYKNLVNYIWVSALDINTTGAEVLTDNNETKRLLTYEDTKVKMAEIGDIDPDTMGINFNKNSIDKLRILKTHNELLRLKDFTASASEPDIKRIKQFVASTFARLGKTEYIFPMFLFGIYDFTQMDRDLLTKFMNYIRKVSNQLSAAPISLVFTNKPPVGAEVVLGTIDEANIDLIINAIMNIPANQRSQITIDSDRRVPGNETEIFVDLKQFMNNNDFTIFSHLNSLLNNQGTFITSGFFQGFLEGLTNTNIESKSIKYAHRAVAALHYCVMQMLNDYNKSHGNSVFAIDDTYFILAIKAIAGKVMTITGINSLYKDPSAYRNSIAQNKTRLIMGGANSILEDPEVIDDAVELYVRLPLLVEFYRAIFDNANKKYKQETINDSLDEEQISYVPEIGNVWSNLIKNIFDKAKHIENGVYTSENMRKIVSEVNAIYSHYKSNTNSENLVRHIVLELVAEINRRYGVIKRQELLNYYQVLNATKRNTLTVSESNYSNNDFDILNEEVEFEEKSPSDAFINVKNTFANSNVSMDVKINKLTDYKILKDFREKINNNLDVVERHLHANNLSTNNFLTLVDRIRMLKKAVASKSSKDEKYDLIIKAIEESEAMNQSSNDIFSCFHEMVLVPLNMLNQLHKALDRFILAIYVVMSRIATPNPAAIDVFQSIAANPIFIEEFEGESFATKILNEAVRRELFEFTDGATLDIQFGRGIAQFINVGPNRVIGDMGGANINSGTGTAQLLLTEILSNFCQNSGNLAKLNISSTGRITVDLSEYQTLCEYLVSNTKFMIDKFTGLVPTKLIDSVSKPGKSGTIYWIEDKLINQIFNKLDKNDRNRALVSVDNLNKIMPMISTAIFSPQMNIDKLITEITFSNKSLGAAPLGAIDLNVAVENTLQVIMDAFSVYDQTSRIFKVITTDPAGAVIPTPKISQILFNPKKNTSIIENNIRYGLMQEFNTLIAHYLNDLYDAQSHKLYSKLFQKFANNAFLESLNGRAFVDFQSVLVGNSDHLSLSKDSSVLSATLAYTMKTMSGRVHPISGVKLYEVSNLQEVNAHVLEKYRAYLPLYLRLFNIFLERCKFYRKVLSKVNVNNNAVGYAGSNVEFPNDATVKDHNLDNFITFATKGTSMAGTNGTDARDKVLLYIDDMVNGISSLIEDANAVHKELRDMDASVPLFFDIKRDFTKSFYLNNKELPYAPVSILAAGFGNKINPFPTLANSNNNNKFVYGMQSLLIDDFKLSTAKVPYMKKLLGDFNGYNSKINNISESKFNDMLKYLGQAFNFYYDWKYFNGKVFGDVQNIPNNTGDLPPIQQAEVQILTAAVNSINELKMAETAETEAVNNLANNPGVQKYIDDQADTNAQLVIALFAAKAAVAGVAGVAAAAVVGDTADALQVVYDAAVPGRLDANFPIPANEAIRRNILAAVGVSNISNKTYQETNSADAVLTIIESINPTDSKNKIADYIKNMSTVNLPRFDRLLNNSNPRLRVIMVNIVDLGIVPINVHSLMREIPLANLYNYAMTFDIFVNELSLENIQKKLIKSPYTKCESVNINAGTGNLELNFSINPADNIAINDGLAKSGDTSLRFLTDVVGTKLCKPVAGRAALPAYQNGVKDRLNSKLVRNLTFLSLVQFAIKKKVKQELDFINSRVVSNTAAVSNVITDALVDGANVSDDLFQF